MRVAPLTETAPAPGGVRLRLAASTDRGSTAASRVAETTAVSATPVAPSAGDREATWALACGGSAPAQAAPSAAVRRTSGKSERGAD